MPVNASRDPARFPGEPVMRRRRAVLLRRVLPAGPADSGVLAVTVLLLRFAAGLPWLISAAAAAVLFAAATLGFTAGASVLMRRAARRASREGDGDG